LRVCAITSSAADELFLHPRRLAYVQGEQVVFTEYDGEKKVSNLPYSFSVNADERRARPGSQLRSGARIPKHRLFGNSSGGRTLQVADGLGAELDLA
jgi:hypothetical protein